MHEIYEYKKEERFAVVRKLPTGKRYRSDFANLHPTREAAEQEALRLSQESMNQRIKFYVAEIVSITSNEIQREPNEASDVATG